MSKEKEKELSGRSRGSQALRQVLSIAIAATVALAARSSLADHYVVPSGSMLPTVHEGDRIVVDKLAYGLRVPFSRTYVTEPRDPSPGDVVVLLSPETGIVLLKRIVAGPGDTIEIIGGRLLLNGERLPVVEGQEELVEVLAGRRHGVRLTRGGGPDFGPITLPADRYLVVGDNRGDSRDGRFFGLVERSAVLGRAVACYYGESGFQWRSF
jgi:signal peptidase I